MTVARQERVFAQTWTEHQQIRLLLAEIQASLSQLTQTQHEQVGGAPDRLPQWRSHRLRYFVNQLRQRFAYEGANGEVAITLACDRLLQDKVSSLALRCRKLERAIRDVLDALESCENSDAQIRHLGRVFPQLSSDITNYLSDKMDALRESLVNIRESVSTSV